MRIREIAFLPVSWLLPYWSVHSCLYLRSSTGCSCCLKEVLGVRCRTWYCWGRCLQSAWMKAGFPKCWRRWETAGRLLVQSAQLHQALWSRNCLLPFWVSITATYPSRLSAFKGLNLKSSPVIALSDCRKSPVLVAESCAVWATALSHRRCCVTTHHAGAPMSECLAHLLSVISQHRSDSGSGTLFVLAVRA